MYNRFMSKKEHSIMEKLKSSERIFELAPGIHLDFYVVVGQQIMNTSEGADHWSLRVDYCRRGRFEGKFSRGRYDCLLEGEYAINSCNLTLLAHVFPLELYEGLSLIIRESDMTPSDRARIEELGLDMAELNQCLDTSRKWYRKRAAGPISVVFDDLYRGLTLGDSLYLKLKVFELLYWLRELVDETRTDQVYLTANQAIHLRQVILNVIDRPGVTLQSELDTQGLERSRFYRQFQALYGESPVAYIRQYRLNRAAVQLKISNLSITDIALEAGYQNASKFSAAFRKIYGKTPADYRRS